MTLAETQRDRRAADVAALDREREALAAAEAEVTGLATAAQEERRRLGTIDATRELVRRRRRLVRTATGAVEAAVEARSAAATLDERRRQLAESTAAEDRTRAAEQVVAENPATAEGLAAIRQADQDLVLAGKLRDAAATAVTVTGPAGAEAVVDGETRPLDGGVDLRAVRETTIGLGEYEVVVTPARDVRDAQAEVDDARQARDRLLAAWGVGDVAEAEQLARRRVTAGEAVTEARIAFSRVTGGRSLGELREEVDALTRRAEEAYRRWRTSALALAEDVGDSPAGDGGPAGAPESGAVAGDPVDAAGGEAPDAGVDVPDPAGCARRLVTDWGLTPAGDDAPAGDTRADQATADQDSASGDAQADQAGTAGEPRADQDSASGTPRPTGPAPTPRCRTPAAPTTWRRWGRSTPPWSPSLRRCTTSGTASPGVPSRCAGRPAAPSANASPVASRGWRRSSARPGSPGPTPLSTRPSTRPAAPSRTGPRSSTSTVGTSATGTSTCSPASPRGPPTGSPTSARRTCGSGSSSATPPVHSGAAGAPRNVSAPPRRTTRGRPGARRR
ncbi:hypothetical protein I6I09_00565 [Corynebacterium bovis]|uniref:hypothetical protein n=1 Tax=Corynebacterium bovis TaxID=36808 RepID=UPI0018E1C666|nr:hypothetical protein [Corynebacterium bovis]QQC47533.1 hypothetical protein I6I09_00565 [Corynebacterium bovis]